MFINSLGSMSHRLRRILCRVDDMESSSCMLSRNHPRDGIPRGFLTKSEVCAERERVSIVATRWFGSERGAIVETEESAVPRRGGG